MKITLGKLTTLIMEETERLLSEMDISDDDLDTLFNLARTAEPKRKKRKKRKAKVNPLSHLTIDEELFMGDDEDYMLEGK